MPRPATGGARRGTATNGDGGAGAGPPRLPKRLSSRRPRRPEPGRVKKLRLAIIVAGLGLLAMVSTIFGMMMAVAGDLPQLENKVQFAQAKNSEVYDSQGRKLGTLLSNNRRILVESDEISPYIKQAVVSIEDRRFYEHRGVDFMGIGRAVVADIMPGGSTQGASTITMQFVKNALEAQGSRTPFQKLREAALAYHLERQWDKDKILTQYLNTIYFGEGAYGIEAAARTYFGKRHPDCLAEGANPCASEVTPEEAAMLAGIITSPSAFSPRSNPNDALGRRNLVLQKMLEQGAIDENQYVDAAEETLPAPSDIEKPEESSLSPYFTSWLRQQVVDIYGPGKAFGGGLDVHTTLDLDMQSAAEQIAYDTLAGIEPTAALAVIDNRSGEVRALVGGNDFAEEPFNLATQGHRQPGSAFKPFTLAAALSNGISSGTRYSSEPKEFKIPGVPRKKEVFEVNNYDDIYYGSNSVASGLTYSDNSVYAELAYDVGLKKVADMAERMGVSTEVSENPAMSLGGLEEGVTPLEMAFAFNTFATGGERVSGTLDTIAGEEKGNPRDDGPVAIKRITDPDGQEIAKNKTIRERVLDEGVADEARGIMGTVVSSGTGKNAATSYDDWGKTGTTENNGDAWFCGGTDHFTACVWVGHFDTNTPMETEYGGNPVDGGTFPALIWSRIMSEMEAIYEAQAAERESDDAEDSDSDSDSGSGETYTPPSDSGSSGSSGGGSGGGSGQPAPAPTPTPAPSGGGGGGGATGGTGGTGL